MKFQTLIAALFFASASAFAPVAQTQKSVAPLQASNIREEVDSIGNNVAVKNLLLNVESSGLLTKVAEAGLLSKAQEAGLSLSKLEPLLALAADNTDILVLVEAATPELLPLLPKVVDLAPGALPLLAAAIQVPPTVLSVVGLGSLGAAVGAVVVIPDDTLLEVAGQTFAAGALGAAGVAALVGSQVLGKVLGK
uniref:Uncharacterized protein n=1 Tax=Pseudo-nitzschia arenysensis TaxID=697910 RepID=A0A7R9ZU16_9STRA|mmetsp:Transcript_31/g.71  ORF Transcript_31/g.71 Transcript_31/m.71 type:complete len:194 (+) Transcript_31:165-746(+)|eukprot:CAMPEP_0116131424 /NCGR_PEP_ID=MMETSP0329-20121206/8997_1 /TAXON_ID=697910 /ORGANISM="Pseudo-nitzschia arenysensis, Strain B593" /LENGTH=193 /DNA_ID=CAMNT_0003625851 /DNA_START=118 /DNA_END=699 /DNA_ORIENTATION=-